MLECQQALKLGLKTAISGSSDNPAYLPELLRKVLLNLVCMSVSVMD